MKLRVYLDTTVISAAEDQRAPDRLKQTLEFFSRANEFELMASELTKSEVLGTPDLARRNLLLARLQNIQLIEITAEMRLLAAEYVNQSIIPAAYEADAIHIAAAVLTNKDVLLS